MNYSYSIFDRGNGEKEHCLELSGHIVANLMESGKDNWTGKSKDDIPGIVHARLAAQHSRVSLVPVPFVGTDGKPHGLAAKEAFEKIVEKLNDRVEKVV